LTAEGTTSKGTGSISCEVEFCIFYRLSLRTLRTKDVIFQILQRLGFRDVCRSSSGLCSNGELWELVVKFKT
jgi:hypothetical protein